MPPTVDEVNEIAKKQKEEKARLREEKRQNELLNQAQEAVEIES
jgi:uncharacterized protein YnzC (UPF0291/DUF896 family)